MNNKLVAGVDVSKYFSDMCILAPDNTIYARVKIYHDITSMKRSLTFLEEANHTYNDKPVIVMESTAHYHRLLEQFYKKNGYDVIVINPMQSHAINNFKIRKVKNDKADALKIAQLYRLQSINPTKTICAELLDIRDLCRERRKLIKLRSSYVNKLTAFLDQSFPGYAKLFSRIYGGSSLAVLSLYPTPKDVLSARKSQLRKVIGIGAKRGKKSTYGLKKANLLIDIAKQAIEICIDRSSFDLLIKAQANMLQSLIANIKALEKVIDQLSSSNEFINHNIELLTTIPGIGRYSATVILSEIGDFTSFKRAKQLVAFCGLDPGISQSGLFTSTGNKISKRGSSHIRAILDMCTHVAVHPMRTVDPINPVLAEYYNRKKEAKPPKVAKCAAMRKMVSYIFSVLKHQKPFEIRLPQQHCESMRFTTSKPAA